MVLPGCIKQARHKRDIEEKVLDYPEVADKQIFASEG